jgi:hypothetical protein
MKLILRTAWIKSLIASTIDASTREDNVKLPALWEQSVSTADYFIYMAQRVSAQNNTAPFCSAALEACMVQLSVYTFTITLCADSCSATYMGQACSGLCLVHVEGLKKTKRPQTRVPPVPFVRPLADLIPVPCYVWNDVSHRPSAYRRSRHNKARRCLCDTICAQKHRTFCFLLNVLRVINSNSALTKLTKHRTLKSARCDGQYNKCPAGTTNLLNRRGPSHSWHKPFIPFVA